jgi:hypothetical protein
MEATSLASDVVILIAVVRVTASCSVIIHAYCHNPESHDINLIRRGHPVVNLFHVKCFKYAQCTKFNTITKCFFLKPPYATLFFARFYCALLTCFGPDRWPSSGNMYIKCTKVTTVYVNGSVEIVA